MTEKKDVMRETDAESIRLAKTLMRSARYGAIAVIEADTGMPFSSRVGVATDVDGSPVILISGLSMHTRALVADPRCSIMLGEPGKGDALAYARLTVIGKAAKVERETPQYKRVRRRFLARNPKAQLYVGLGDFDFYRVEVERAALNAGFGKAYLMTAADIINSGTAVEALAASEAGAVDHMNDDHLDAIALYARHLGGNKAEAEWKIAGLDVDGMDLVAGDLVQRVFFPEPLTEASELRPALVAMAKAAREALAEA